MDLHIVIDYKPNMCTKQNLSTWVNKWETNFGQYECNLTWIPRGGGASSKLGAQITNESLKSGCAKSARYLSGAQKVGAQMRTLAH